MATMKKSAKKYAMGGTVTTETTKPTKPTVKPKVVPKKAKTVSERLGDVTLRDIKNAGEDTFQLITLGGYGKIKKALGSEYKYKEIGEKKYGGKIKKAQYGSAMSTASGLINGMQTISSPQKTAKPKEKEKPKTPMNSLSPEEAKRNYMRPPDTSPERFPTSGVSSNVTAKKGKTISKAKKGATIKKAQYGGAAASMVPPMKKGGSVKKKTGMHKMPDGSMMKNSKMKMGGTIKKAQTGDKLYPTSGVGKDVPAKNGKSMKKCKYGCN